MVLLLVLELLEFVLDGFFMFLFFCLFGGYDVGDFWWLQFVELLLELLDGLI